MKIIGIIPARYASTRFPGKPLTNIAGQTMIQRVLNRVDQTQLLDRIYVATDDQRIFEHVERLGHQAIMTSASHQSGTDRCAEALALCDYPADAIVNIQGDEPFVHVTQLKTLVEMIQQQGIHIATLVKAITDVNHLSDPNKVKVVRDHTGKALYFSRQAIPFQRSDALWLEQGTYFKHIGLYAYRTATLKELVKLPVSWLERSESLEQLRWLEQGFSIHTGLTEIETPAIDTPEDLAQLLSNWSKYEV
jgi:3-deoxy-manno-octulosonate cytidylyltransferase (CMP-KDO synthetase)